MAKLLLTGVDGNLGQLAADVLLTLEPVSTEIDNVSKIIKH